MGYSEAEYLQAQENMRVALEKLRQTFLEAIQPLVNWWENLPPEVRRMFRRLDRGVCYVHLMHLKYQRDTIPFVKRGCKL